MDTKTPPTPQAAPARCSGCDAFMDTPLYCGGCHTLHPAESANHFQLLGLAPVFDLEPAALRQRYLAASRNVHPDRVRSDDQSLSLRISAMLNDAYRVLGDPLLRAEYLLELSGGRPASEDKTVPPDVLAETLMLRGEIDDAKASGDSAALADVREQALASFERLRAEIEALARRLPGDEAIRRGLRVALNSVRYYQRALAQFEGT